MKFIITTLLIQFICLITLSAQVPSDSIQTPDTLQPIIQGTRGTLATPDTLIHAFHSIQTVHQTQQHSFKTDVSLTSIPWITAGILLRRDRKNFRNLRNKFVYEFHNETDNYSQYLPLVAATGLKAAGYEGRSNWPRYLVSSAASYVVMAALVNGIKYTAKELRPDDTSHNSFPSGHTATAFAAATIFHKEYGMTRSPWFSIAGYALATATGCMRVLNNRHWVSDTFAGAGIGILSTELGYSIGDLLFKGKGIIKNDLFLQNDLTRYPSFFNIQTGVGLGNQSLKLPVKDLQLEEYYDELPAQELKFTVSTQIGVEGAYFFNPYIGVGGRLRISSKRVKNWKEFTQNPLGDLADFSPTIGRFIEEYTLKVNSDHLSEFTTGAGLYFSLPISSHCAVGTKLLIGRSYMHGIDIDAHAKGVKMDVDMSYENNNGKKFLTYEVRMHQGNDGSVTTNKYDTSWEYLNMEGDKSTNFATGVSFTFAQKSFFAWRLYLDYDFCRQKYNITYAPTQFIKAAAENLTYEGQPANADSYIHSYTSRQRKYMSTFSLGAAFSVSF